MNGSKLSPFVMIVCVLVAVGAFAFGRQSNSPNQTHNLPAAQRPIGQTAAEIEAATAHDVQVAHARIDANKKAAAQSDRAEIERVAAQFINDAIAQNHGPAMALMTATGANSYGFGGPYGAQRYLLGGGDVPTNFRLHFGSAGTIDGANADYNYSADQQDWASGKWNHYLSLKLKMVKEKDVWKIDRIVQA